MIQILPILCMDDEGDEEGDSLSFPKTAEDLRTLHEALVIAEHHSANGETLAQYDRAYGIAAARKRTERIRDMRLKIEKLQGL